MTATKERLHDLIDEIPETEADEILKIIQGQKEYKGNGSAKTANQKVEMEPDTDDEVWMYVC